jgi:hypothetical protein
MMPEPFLRPKPSVQYQLLSAVRATSHEEPKASNTTIRGERPLSRRIELQNASVVSRKQRRIIPRANREGNRVMACPVKVLSGVPCGAVSEFVPETPTCR